MFLLFCFIFGCVLSFMGFGLTTWQYWIIGIFFVSSYNIGLRDGKNK